MKCDLCSEEYDLDDICINDAGHIRCVFCLGFKERHPIEHRISIDDVIAHAEEKDKEEEAT